MLQIRYVSLYYFAGYLVLPTVLAVHLYIYKKNFHKLFINVVYSFFYYTMDIPSI